MRNKYGIRPEQWQTAENNGIMRETVYTRIKLGLSVDEAVSKPLRPKLLSKSQKKRARDNGISLSTVYGRLKNGWSTQMAISAPLQSGKKPGRKGRLSDEEWNIAKENGLPEQTVYSRLHAGWNDYDAVRTPSRKTTGGKKRKKRNVVTEEESILADVARIKWLNANDYKNDPIAIPAPMRKKLEAMNMTIHDVEARI